MAKVKKTYVPGKNRNHKHHNWWKYLLCILLGQILIIPEMLIGIGTAASSITNEQLLKMLGLKPEDYLSDDVSKDTILSLAAKFIGGNYKIESLGDVEQISPALENLYDEYCHYAAEYGVTIDKDEFFSTKFNDFPTYAMNLLMEVKLADTLAGANLDISSVQVLSSLGPAILYKVPLARIELVTGGDNPTVLPADYKIALSDDTASFDLSDTVKFYPAETTESEIEWSSDNEAVAKIEGNEVKAVSNGTATLTAKPCEGVDSQTVTVEVTNFTGTPTPTPDPEPETKNHVIKREGEGKPQEDEGGEGQSEGGEEQTTAKHEGEHHYTDGHCDIELSNGTTCNELWKESRTLGEIISMFKEKQFTKMFGDTTLGGLIQSLPPGLDALGEIKIASLFTDPMGALKSISLGAFLGGSDNPVFKTLGSFTIGQLMEKETFESLTIGALLDIPEDATGIEGLLRECSLSMDSIMGKINDAKVGDLIKIDPSDSLMNSLKDCYIMKTDSHGGIETAITTIHVGDIMKDLKEGDMLYPFKDCTVGELSTKFSSMYLYELLNTRTYLEEGATVEKAEFITIKGLEYEVLYDTDNENKPYYIEDNKKEYIEGSLVSNIEENDVIKVKGTTYQVKDDGDGKRFYITAAGVTKLLCETKVTTGTGDKQVTDYLNLGNMQEGMGNLMNSARIVDILGNSNDKFVKLFLDCSLSNIGERITQLKIGQIMPDETTGILGALSGCYLSDVPDDDPNGMTCADKIATLKLNEIMTGLDDMDNPVIKLIADKYLYDQPLHCSICNKQPTGATAKVGDPCSDQECLGTLEKDASVLDVINGLTIGEAMGIDKTKETNEMLLAMADVPVSKPSEITEAIKECRLGALIKIDNNSPAMLQELQNVKLDNLDSAFNTIHISGLIGADQMFDDAQNPTKLKGIWSLMFEDGATKVNISSTDEFDQYELEYGQIYTSSDLNTSASYDKNVTCYYVNATALQAAQLATIEDFGPLMSGVGTKIVNANLKTLADAGLLGNPAPDLTKPMGSGKTLGDMTLLEIINWINNPLG